MKNSVPPEPGIDPLSSLSVIVPVYECAERLPRHLEALQTFAHRVQEIVWVITESPDGSDQVAREAAERLGGRILEMPRGLYSAWNAGIAATTGEYIYISTVGDVISIDGLTTLIGLLKKTGADVAVSPPAIYPPSKANLKRSRHWPLFHFEKLLRPYAGKMIPRRQAILMQILSGASGLTGSCASCLFRASTLKKRPFPTYYHHYGDTAWLYQNLKACSMAYFPKSVARFWIHDPEVRRVVDKHQIYKLARELVSGFEGPEVFWLNAYLEALNKIDLIRDCGGRIPWWLRLDAWRSRCCRNNSVKNLMKLLTKSQ